MLSEEEFNYQKGELIKGITGKSINGYHLTFLIELSKLKNQGILSIDDITNIKLKFEN